LKAKVWTRLGRLVEALAWAREQKLSADDNLSYLREFEHLTLARVLIARFQADHSEGDLQTAMGLLARLLQAAEKGGRNGSVIEILILQSLAAQAQSDQPGALASLEHALTLAEPEGYVRIFVDEGVAMRSLIEKQTHNRDHRLSGYADRLLAAYKQPGAATKPALIHSRSGMVEPLSEREMEVLRLLRSELSGPEIAGELIVSLNTLRTHTKNIFNKLGVNSRRAAIRRAEELDLF
jgi:LuxR family maltose regulon positive regulatory protein